MTTSKPADILTDDQKNEILEEALHAASDLETDARPIDDTLNCLTSVENIADFWANLANLEEEARSFLVAVQRTRREVGERQREIQREAARAALKKTT